MTYLPLFLAWFRTNWQGLAAGVVLTAAFFAIRGPGQAPIQAIATAGASQSLSGTAQAHSGATILAGGRPAMPCPADKVCPEVAPVKIVYDCGAQVAGAVATALSASAQVAQAKGLPLSIWAGAGVVSDFQAVTGAYGEVRGDLGDWSIPLRLDSGLRASLGLSYRFLGP